MSITAAAKVTTGPRSFKATLHQREKTERYTGTVLVEEAVHTFDAADVHGKREQAALFADYKAAARELGLIRNTRSPRTVASLPDFTAAPISAIERQWLGREVGFTGEHYERQSGAGTVISLAPRAKTNYGTVISLAPRAKSVWVYVPDSGFYVPDSGFYVVHVDSLLEGASAC